MSLVLHKKIVSSPSFFVIHSHERLVSPRQVPPSVTDRRRVSVCRNQIILVAWLRGCVVTFFQVIIVDDEQLLLITSFHCHLLIAVLLQYRLLGVVVSRGKVDGETGQRDAKSESAVTEKMHVDEKLSGE